MKAEIEDGLFTFDRQYELMIKRQLGTLIHEYIEIDGGKLDIRENEAEIKNKKTQSNMIKTVSEF